MFRGLRKPITTKQTMRIVYLVNKTKKFLAIIGMLGIIWSSGPMQLISVLAEDTTPIEVPIEEVHMPDYPTTTDPDYDPSSIALLHEVLEERTNASKTFRKVDGTLETAFYEQNIHYYENGEWEQIDNSFNDLGQEFENKENSFKLKFPKTIDDNKTIKFSENGYGVNWSILDINASPIIYNDSVLTPNSIRELININRTVMYEDILPGVDIEYVLFGDQLKENIILEQYVQDFSLSFEYKLKDLSLVQDIYGKYMFVNDLNEVVYQFTDLFMFDDSLNYSEDILLSVTELGNKTYEVTLTPSDEWLQNAVYPVVIDPAFEDPGDGGGGDPNPTYNSPLIRDKETSNTGVIETSYYQRVGRYSSNNYKTYVEVDFSSVPDDAIITYSHLLVGTYTNPTSTCSDSNGCVIEVRKVNQTSVWTDITSSSFSDVEDFIEDYNIISDNMGIRRWDVSKAFYDWHSASYDLGILELSMEYGIHDNYVSFASETYSLLTGPNMVIGYQSTTGLHDYWTYHSAPAGDAGTIMVSDFTGELNLVRNDYTGNHSGMVIDLGMFYSENLKDIDIGYGYGWRTNFNSTVNYDSPDYEVVNPSGSTTRYEQVTCSDVTDEPEIRNYSLSCYLANDGSRKILVKQSIIDVYDLDNDGLTLDETPEDDTDNNDYVEVISVYTTDRVRHLYYQGKLTVVEDLKNTFFTKVSFLNDKILKVEDHYGNYVDLEYDINEKLEYELVQLCQTWDEDGDCTKTNLVKVAQFLYTSGVGNIGKNLSKVIYHTDYSGIENFDITVSSTQELYDFKVNSAKSIINYSYDDGSGEDNKLRSAKSSTDLVVSVDYYPLNEEPGNRVKKYEFTKDNSNFGFVEISYNQFETLFTNHKSNQERYTFDSYGHTVNVLDDYGNAVFYRYLNAFSDSINGAGSKFLHHKLVESSTPQKTQLNPVSNHSFEFHNAPTPSGTDDNWSFEIDSLGGASSSAGISSGYYTYESVFGDKSARIVVNSGQSAHLEQIIVLDAGEYTLSGYIKTSGSNAYIDVVNETSTVDSSQRTASGSGEWDYVEYTFTVANDNTLIELRLYNYSSGYTYYDHFQVTEAFVDTRVNILDNPSFESNTTGWTLSGVSRVANSVETTEGDLHDSILGDYSLKITGDPIIRRYFERTLTSSEFDAGQYYIVAGWAKGDISAISSNLNGEDDKVYGILVTLSDGTTSEDLYFPFNSDIETWQYQANKFYVDSSIISIKVKVMFQGEGSVMFDGLQVYNESFGTEIAYDDYGNIDKIKLPDSDDVIQYGYSLDNRFFEEYADYLYKRKWNKRDDGEQIAALGSEYLARKLTRNADNKVTSIIAGQDSNQDGVIDGDYFTNFYSYTNNQQHIDLITNEFGKQQDVDFDILTGLLEGYTNYNSVSSSFTYDKYGRKKTHTKDGTTYTYHYEENELSEIEVNGMTYKLEYDSKGRLIEILIGTGLGTGFTGNTIKEYKYTEFGVDTNGDEQPDVFYEENILSQGIYGNNDTIVFNYNDEDLISSIEYGTCDPQTEISTTVVRYEFEYNSSNQISKLKDFQQDKTYYYNYDISGKLTKVTDETGNIIEYEYDEFGNIKLYYFNIEGVSNTTNYLYDDTVSLYDKTTFGSNELDYTFESDGLRRLTNISLKINGYVKMSKTVEYYDNLGSVYGNASYRIKSIDYTLAGNTLTEAFEYTDSGYISKITRTTSSVSYIEEFFYDEKDQLIRENNQQRDYTNKYIYDEYGNLTSQYFYSFYAGNGSLSTPGKVESYSYDSVWKDKVYQMSVYYPYNPSANYTLTYSYDTIGNVIGIDDSRGTTNDVTLGWEGRNLITYEVGVDDISFTYNAEGVRNSKTVNGTTTIYYLDGYNVLLEETGSNQIAYTYDYDGTLLSMSYNGTEYYYVKNSFGDITHIIDSSGSTMVKYEYDAYGNIVYQYDSGLGLDDINPYRYRGYRFDVETGLYYLQSRYYNPETGRFINADGILKSSNSVLGFNMFAYAENNPVMNWDPTGYYCDFYDSDNDGRTEEGGGCGGSSSYWDTGGTYQTWSSGYSAGSTSGSYSSNDVYNTGYNSGMGSMISTYGPTYNWMNGVYSYGNMYSVGYGELTSHSTGRTEPVNLTEQMHMKQVQSDPFGNGTRPANSINNDYRWSSNNGWNKYHNSYTDINGYTSVIHFNYNSQTDMYGDFKFK